MCASCILKEFKISMLVISEQTSPGTVSDHRVMIMTSATESLCPIDLHTPKPDADYES